MRSPARIVIGLLISLSLYISFPVWADTKRIELVVAGAKAHKIIHVELAVTRDERQEGLMFRDKLAADSGMLFIFPAEEILRFWMKDTIIPLDILFFDKDGRFINKFVNVPPLTLTNRVSLSPAIYVLEVAGKTSETWDLGGEIHLKLPLATP
ncbi:DUF192 domain-containing protein [Candidatus Puniceispirillum marinum]|uniref:DUF192 domain-containing protein n=1 Tax=Puniceispirillum marinum (strain IMCC1322) TaxID=488538 RepID=D5BQY6_PUNMI|nr:DUF192 domain-containing protein [Candidatus Puniceispirillum marinum]ADE38700.1 protein of unknown function DUF192 [Candidatus Puniceispirillum marinum IMCC1322]